MTLLALLLRSGHQASARSVIKPFRRGAEMRWSRLGCTQSSSDSAVQAQVCERVIVFTSLRKRYRLPARIR